MEELSIRPGFNLVAAFRGHLSSVRRITYNAHTKQFLSMDEHSLKAWTVERGGNTRLVRDVQFPGFQQNFITAMVLSQDLNLLFTSCLDDNLRLYNERLRLKSCMPWSNGVVRELVFYEPRSLLVTAGSYGVKVWECLLDYEAFRTDKTSDLYDVPKIKDGSVQPWCFGKYQHVRLRHTLHVPGARLMGATSGGPSHPTAPGATPLSGLPPSFTAADSDGSGGSADASEVSNAPWCDRIALHTETAMVLAMFQGHVYGFDIMNGTCLSAYTSLYTQPVTSCVFVPESDLLFTTAMDTSAMLWRIPRGSEAQRFKQFGRSYAPMTCVTQDPDMRHVLTTSLDGSVTLWDMDTLVPVFKMKLAQAPISTAFYKPNAFFLATGTEVKLFAVSHLFEAWMDCNSPVTSLKPLSYGLVQAEFADSSVRVLDTHTPSRSDKSVITTMPQLSAALLVSAAVSLPAARMFALLADGVVHVWQLHLRRPPSFVAAWTHLTRESAVSISFIDGSCLPAGLSHRVVLPTDPATGLTLDHLALGTAAGDCLLIDINSGHISFRFPAFKHQPLQILASDLDRGLLMTVSRTTIKIWNLMEVRCLHELHTSKPVNRLELLEGRAIAGTVSGSVHVVELLSGLTTPASATAGVDHQDAVTGLGPSHLLQHFVTGSRDSHIKIFDRDKRFKVSIYLGAPVSAVAYLNEAGDILAAMDNRLVVVRADKYDKPPYGPAPKQGSIYEELRGKGRTPSALLRTLQCRLQRLTRAKPAPELFAAAAAAAAGAGGDGDEGGDGRSGSGGRSNRMGSRGGSRGGSPGGGSGGPHRTPPPVRWTPPPGLLPPEATSPLRGAGKLTPRGGHEGRDGEGAKAEAAAAAAAAAATKSGGAGGTAGGTTSGAAGVGGGISTVASGSSSGNVLRGVLKTPESALQGGRPATREGGSRGGMRTVQWHGEIAPDSATSSATNIPSVGEAPSSSTSLPSVGASMSSSSSMPMAAAPLSAETSVPRPGSAEALSGQASAAESVPRPASGASSASVSSLGTSAASAGSASRGAPPHSPSRTSTSASTRRLSVARSAVSGASAARPPSATHSGRHAVGATGIGAATQQEEINTGAGGGGDPGRSEDEDEGRTIAREMYPLVYNYNLQREKMRIDRLVHGFPSIHARLASRTAMMPSDAVIAHRPMGISRGTPRDSESVATSSAAMSPGQHPSTPASSSSTATTTTTTTTSVTGGAAMGASGGPAGGGGGGGAGPGTSVVLRLGSLRNVGDVGMPEDEDEEGSTDGEGGDRGDSTTDGEGYSSTSTSVSGAEAPAQPAGLSISFRRTLPVIASPSAFFDGHVPPEALTRTRKGSGSGVGMGLFGGAGGKAAGSSGAGRKAASEGGAGGEKKKKMKKKKKKKKRARRVAVGQELVDELKARVDYEIRAEVKTWEKHQTVQRLATSVFLPKLGGAPASAPTSGAQRNSPPLPPGLSISSGGGDAADAGGGGGGEVQGPMGRHSFKSFLKSMGIRASVVDIARMLEDPGRFVVAQQQQPAGGGGNGAQQSKKTSMATTASAAAAAAAAAAALPRKGTNGGEGEGEQERPKALLMRGGYGFKSCIEVNSPGGRRVQLEVAGAGLEEGRASGRGGRGGGGAGGGGGGAAGASGAEAAHGGAGGEGVRASGIVLGRLVGLTSASTS